MDYTAQNLEYAVSVFYNGEQTERAKAHAWLTTAQRVPEAWNFVWELLQPTKGTEIQFYAATTLHTKILRCWNEVPPESYEELKNKILQAVFTYSKGPKIVTNRLCISLAAFILQQGTVDLATILSPLSSAENTALLLEVLTVIPEEFNSMTMGMSLRAKNRASLQAACPAVLGDMLRCLETVYNDYSNSGPSEQTVQSWVTAATCANSWLTLGGEEAAENSRGKLPDRMPICRVMLAVVHLLFSCNAAVSDSALDACEACLSAVRTAGSAAAAARYPNAALELLTQMAALMAPVIARDNVPNSINEELLSALITCCVSLGECHTRTLVQAAESSENSEGVLGAKQLLELILAAQNAPGHYPLHETRSNLVFGFWYTLQDEVLHVKDRSQGRHPVWREVFSRLLTTLVIKSEAPVHLQLTKDDDELLRCYRQDIADTVMYCYGVLGDWCWSTVEEAFTAATTESRREAAMHIFSALSDAAPAQRVPPALFALLHHAVNISHTSTNKQMLTTALECLGGYGSWLSSLEEPRAEELGRSCVTAAGAALQRCPTAAALALRKLCSDYSAPAAALAADIVRVAQSSEGRADAWVWRQLVAAAGAALSAAEPTMAAALLHDLATSLEVDLRAQAQEPGAVRGACSAAESCAALLGELAGSAQLGAALLCTIAPALPAYATHPALVESMFHILKQAVSSLMEDCVPMVTDIAQLTVTGFNTCPCASGLDVVKLILLITGGEWDGARNFFYTSVSTSARVLATDPSSRPDVTEGLFTLLKVITKKKPQLIDWLEEIIQDLIDLACGCVRMWEAAGSRAACAWLAALALQRPHHMQRAAAALTAHVLACIGGVAPRNQIEPFAELLLSMNRAGWAAGGGLPLWLRLALAEPGFPTHHAADAHKQKFITAVAKEKSSKRRLLEAILEFSLVCRGLVDTEYARQTIASKQLVA